MWAKLRTIALTAVAIWFLHVIFATYTALTEGSAMLLLKPTREILGVVVLVALWSGIWGRSLRLDRAIHVGLTVFLVLSFLLSIGEAFARREFGYDVILVLHLPFVPELVRMMYNAEPLSMFLVYMAVVVGAFAVAIIGSYLAVGRIVQTCKSGLVPRLVVPGVVGAYVLVAGLLFGFHPPLTKEIITQVDLAINLDKRVSTTAERMLMEAKTYELRSPFKKMANRPNIYLFIIESYGKALFDDPDFAPFRDDFITRMGARIDDAGYTVRSRYMRAPVFGGSSWMADATLLCGVKVDNQRRYESLTSAPRRCLSTILQESGYHTVYACSNTTYIDEKFENIFSYDKWYIKNTLNYKGPRFTWSFMPDQYVINYIHDHEIEVARDKPLFVTYVLTSSHHPWKRIPPLVEDWRTIGDGSIFAKLPAQSFENAFVKGKEYKPAFMYSVQYSFESVVSYLPLLEDDDGLIIILGDHQPRHPIADMKKDSWAVPIHVLSRNPDVVERFTKLGYKEGLVPKSADEPGLEQFMRHLFAAYSEE